MAPRKLIKPGIVLSLLAGAVALFIHLNRPESLSSKQSTRDAYVQADFTVIAPQISGLVSEVMVAENQRVAAGDVLVRINERDFEISVETANAQVVAAQAEIESLKSGLLLQQSAIRQAQAAVASDLASLSLAEANAERYRNLAADGSGTLQAKQKADAELSIILAGKQKSDAGLEAARQQVALLQAELAKAEAVLKQTQAALAAAALHLSYTEIRAPISGTIGQTSVRNGAFVSAGKPLMAIFPLEEIYITASYRETQLARVRPGQEVIIKADAIPGEILRGTVQSLGPASGATYSPVPPHNASGNFTKIVQRLPVRIEIGSGQAAAQLLRVGMSVETIIDTASRQATTLPRWTGHSGEAGCVPKEEEFPSASAGPGGRSC